MLVSNGTKTRNIGEAQMKEYEAKGYSPIVAEAKPEPKPEAKAPAKKGGK